MGFRGGAFSMSNSSYRDKIMAIKKININIISKIVFGMLVLGAQSTATYGMETPKPNRIQSSLMRSPEDYTKYSIDMDYIREYTNGCLDTDIHCIAIPGGLYLLDKAINAILKEKNLPHFDIIELADPRIKSKGFCLRRGQMNALGPLIGGHENFIKLGLKYTKPLFGKDIPETVHHIDGINYFTNLEELTITNYTESGYSSGLYAEGRYESLKSLSPGIKELRKLKSLTLDESCLETLPSNLHELPCLETLKLTCYTFNLDPLWTMTNLKELVLRAGIIKKRLPGQDYQFQTDNFSLKELPAEIGSLVNLEVLNLELNELQDLPCTFSSLTNLKELLLGWNKFVTLPPVVGTLVSLQKLTMEGNGSIQRNQIVEFPESLSNLTNLTFLNLRSNKIQNIPRKIGELTNLRALFFESNDITKIPSEIHKLSHLVYLSLMNNGGRGNYWNCNWAWDGECIRGIEGSVSCGARIQDFLADQKLFYEIGIKNILVNLLFRKLNIPPELCSIFHGLITDLHVRDTVMYQELHPVRQISDDNEDDSD